MSLSSQYEYDVCLAAQAPSASPGCAGRGRIDCECFIAIARNGQRGKGRKYLLFRCVDGDGDMIKLSIDV